MKSFSLVSILSVLVILSAKAFSQVITLDSVGMNGLVQGRTDAIKANQLVKFFIRFNNNTSNNIEGFSNGFRIYSPDGAQWTTTSIDTPADASARGWGGAQFDLCGGGVYIFMRAFSGDGQLSDTVYVGGARCFLPGGAAGFNDIVAIITIGPIPNTLYDDRHVCLDSCWFPPGGDWIWADGSFLGIVPQWGGPYCFTIRSGSVATGINHDVEVPLTFGLSQNYPNPFNPTTRIDYSLAEKSHVSLSIYNVLGRQVCTLVDCFQSVGSYSISWDGTSTSGAQVASGFYYYRLKTDKFTSTKKMLLVK